MKVAVMCKLAWNLACVLCLGLLVSACAIGNEYDYKNQVIDFKGETEQKVGVAVVDQRPYVVSGKKEADFIGVQRGGFGDPFDVSTKSDEPLADSISFAIVEALKKQNITAKVLKTTPVADDEKALKALDSSDSTRLLMIYLMEWKSDTLINTRFLYDVKAVVADGKQTTIAEHSLKNSERLAGKFMDPTNAARRNVPNAYRKVIRELINDPKLLEALK